MKRKNLGAPHSRSSRRDRRHKEALERAAQHYTRSFTDQLALIDTRPGESARERARLEGAL